MLLIVISKDPTRTNLLRRISAELQGISLQWAALDDDEKEGNFSKLVESVEFTLKHLRPVHIHGSQKRLFRGSVV